MKSTRRELNKINCRKRILKASRKLFSSKGYEETMIEDIAQRAGVSKATVYNYFSSKEGLLIGTVDELCDRMYLILEKDLADCKTSEEKIKGVFVELVHASLDYPSLSRRIAYLNSREDSALYDSHRKIMILFRQLVVAAQAEGIFRADVDPDHIVNIVIGLYLTVLFQWEKVENSQSKALDDKMIQVFEDILYKYYAKEPV